MNAICLLAALPLLAGAVPTATASAAQPPTEVLFFLDAEDYTDPDTADSIKRFADLFAEEGVKAHFAIVGFLADQLVRWGRQDVLASLRPHLVGTQTMYHSRHPDICEITDVEDFSLAYHRVFDEERRARDAVRSATGGMDVWCAVPPGDSKSYAAYYAWADLGIPFVCDTVVWNRAGDDLWYCNIRQLRYDESIEWLIPGIAKNPPAIRVGKLEIGPADFLFAALEALTTDANEITVMPREQLGNLDDLPELKSFRLKGTWVHTPGLEDRYLSDRMRLQLWTLRRERSGKSVSDVNGLQH